jgi:hypothetical protein
MLEYVLLLGGCVADKGLVISVAYSKGVSLYKSLCTNLIVMVVFILLLIAWTCVKYLLSIN